MKILRHKGEGELPRNDEPGMSGKIVPIPPSVVPKSGERGKGCPRPYGVAFGGVYKKGRWGKKEGKEKGVNLPPGSHDGGRKLGVLEGE